MTWRTGFWVLVLCWSLLACAGEDSAVSTPDASAYAWLDEDTLAAQCLNFSTREKNKLRQAGNLLELRPVALPREGWLYQNSKGELLDHFGWPVGIRVDDSIFVFYVRIAAHGQFDEFYNAAVARSTDGGQTFQQVSGLEKSALDLLDPEGLKFQPASPRTHLGTWGNAAAYVDSRLVVTNFRGVYRSEDKGRSWTLLKSAGLPAQIPTNANWGQCPRLLVHPGKGIVSIGATTDETLLFRSSSDYGETWKEEAVHTGEPLQEPAGTVVFGKLVLMPRHDRERWTQFWSDGEWLPLQSTRTNITPGERDTTDIAYNPVSKRIEAIVTNRIGGGPGSESDNCMTINLWSIAPADLMSGKGDWRFDGTLVRSEGREHDRDNALGLDRDGMHPGGTFIDAEAGYQYIYIYLGFFQGPSGVFQLKRTLDTTALREYLLERDKARALAPFEKETLSNLRDHPIPKVLLRVIQGWRCEMRAKSG